MQGFRFPRGRVLVAAVVAVCAFTSSVAAANAATSVGPPAFASADASATVRRAAGTPHLSYYGGHVLRAVRVVVVVWGSGTYLSQVTRAGTPNIATFFDGIARSPYLDWLREYDTPTEHIRRGSLVGRYRIVPAAADDRNTVDDVANIRPELVAQIRAGHLPAPDPNTVYALFFRNGQVVTQGGGDSNTAFCAYHHTVRFSTTRTIRYAVLPATAAGSHCGHSTAFGNLTTAASHELVEAITDPDVGLARRLGPPLSWYDALYGEIGDICHGLQTLVQGADGRSYVVQRQWSNRRRACVAT